MPGSAVMPPREAATQPSRADERRLVAARLQGELHAAGVAAADVPIDHRVEQALGRDDARAFVLDRDVRIAPVGDVQRMRRPSRR